MDLIHEYEPMRQPTYAILDGLQDPAYAQALSRRWHEAGFENRVEPARQRAALAPGPGDGRPCLEESDLDRAARIARPFGIELRERAGGTFIPDNDPEALENQTRREYRARFAQALVFGLPALALHYAGPLLAGGAASEPAGLFYPWLFEALLVGWACLVGGWPILWQGALALVHLRPTGDLVTALVLLLTWLASAAGVLGLALGLAPWFGQAGPLFHATLFALLLAVGQRCLLYRYLDHLAAGGPWLLRGHRHLAGGWIAGALATGLFLGPRLGVAVALVLPPLAGLAAVNPYTPGPAALLPAVAFALLLILGPTRLEMTLHGAEIEAAAGFGLIATLAIGRGWSSLSSHDLTAGETLP